jgi:4-oxalocrotonate tautomerase
VPFVNVKITSGPEVTVEKKRALVEGITQLLADTLGKRPDQTHIVIDEVDPDNWGFMGMLTTDYRKQRS